MTSHLLTFFNIILYYIYMRTPLPHSIELEEVSFLVHPGSMLSQIDEMSPARQRRYRNLLGEYSTFARTMDVTKHALVVLCDLSENYMRRQKERAPSEYAVADVLDSLRSILHEHLTVLFSVLPGKLDPASVEKHLITAEEIIEARCQHIGDDTHIQVFGESIGVCVPEVATGLQPLVNQVPNVIAALTNARMAHQPRIYKEGGEKIVSLQKRFPTADFIPLPEQFKRGS